MKIDQRSGWLFAAGASVALSGLGSAIVAFAPGLPLPTTLDDFFQPGTQPLTLIQTIQDSPNCASCHGYYDPDQEPYTRWASSMMAQASRDPIFHAALTIAEQDASFSGDLCLRCHTPAAWLDGRSIPTDGSALNAALGDFDGVTCHLCHRLVDPVYDEAENPELDKRILAGLAAAPVNSGNAQYIVDPTDVRRGPFDLGPNFFLHDWAQSPFHRESLLCMTCHDVSNPALVKQPDQSYQVDSYGTPHPTQDKYDEFPIERTASEWSRSSYARRAFETGGRFGGNKTAVSTCQDCHMPDTSGIACPPALLPQHREDLPLHDFNGANSWVLNAVRSLYPDSETGLSDDGVAAAHARTQYMLENAANLHVALRGGDLVARIVNQAGHKLPSGYVEGRRMWLNVRFYDAQGALVAERGAYDTTTAVLTTADTEVYESELGLDATQSALTGLPAGPSFHFVLNNRVYKDNRIPPRGFTNASFANVQAAPVAASYPEERYWDDTSYAIPARADRAEVRLYHQTTSKEYIDFLLQANTTNNKGQIAYDQWVAHGKSRPVLMQRVDVDLGAASCLPPQAYGLAKITSLGREPELGWTGTPSASAGDLHLVVRKGVPGSFGYVLSSAEPASAPFQGGFLYLAAPTARVAQFQLDPEGTATIPMLILPGMIGTEVNYQALFRDPGAPSQVGLTNALHVDFCP